MVKRIFKDSEKLGLDPRSGVYRWYTIINNKEITIYVGNAGGRKTKEPSKINGTLFRGVSEAQRNTFSQDKGNKLDTDFIVGTVIDYFIRKKGCDCYWEHIDVEGDYTKISKEEKKICEKYKPIIQDISTCNIIDDFRGRNISNKWTLDRGMWSVAEREVFKILKKRLKELNLKS